MLCVDLTDLQVLFTRSGRAMGGIGRASGVDRTPTALHRALAGPWLDATTLALAQRVLIMVTGSPDLTLYDIHDAVAQVRDRLSPKAWRILWGPAPQRGSPRDHTGDAPGGRPRPERGGDGRDRSAPIIGGDHPSPPASAPPSTRPATHRVFCGRVRARPRLFSENLRRLKFGWVSRNPCPLAPAHTHTRPGGACAYRQVRLALHLTPGHWQPGSRQLRVAAGYGVPALQGCPG